MIPILLVTYCEPSPSCLQRTQSIGLTGGEPSLLGQSLIELIRCAKYNLPKTALHILSNGRGFETITVRKSELQTYSTGSNDWNPGVF